jgi:hypothetical protein
MIIFWDFVVYGWVSDSLVIYYPEQDVWFYRNGHFGVWCSEQ